MSEPLVLYAPGERRQLAPREYVIGGLLAAGDAMLLIGAPKAGKSALAVAAAHSVATGGDFFGRRVRKGAVVYVAAERYRETDLRLEMAIRDDRGLPPVRLSNAKLLAPGEVARLAAAIDALATETGQRPALIVLDVLSVLLRDVDGDENSARDVGKLTGAIDKLREMTGAAVIVVHHAKRGEARSRGSEALEGWADTIALVDAAKGKGAQRTLRVLRSNSIEEGPKASFQLDAIELGLDEATGTMSTVVLAKPVDALSTPRAKAEEIRLPRDAEAAFSALSQVARDGASAVAMNDWRPAVMLAFGERPQDAKRQAFYHAKKVLTDAGLITIEGDTVSVIRPSA